MRFDQLGRQANKANEEKERRAELLDAAKRLVHRAEPDIEMPPMVVVDALNFLTYFVPCNDAAFAGLPPRD